MPTIKIVEHTETNGLVGLWKTPEGTRYWCTDGNRCIWLEPHKDVEHKGPFPFYQFEFASAKFRGPSVDKKISGSVTLTFD